MNSHRNPKKLKPLIRFYKTSRVNKRHYFNPFLISSLLILLAAACNKEEDNPVNPLPVLSTASINTITKNTAISGGNITSEGLSAIIARGVCWNNDPGPDITHGKTTDGIGPGSFASSIQGLLPNTKYYVRAYATNSESTAYGQEESFTTENIGLKDDLIAYWKLDENNGTTAMDATGNWHLSFVNNPTWSASGKINNAIDFGTASTRYLEKTGVSSGNKNTYTLAAWIYLADGTADSENIIGMNSGGSSINAGAAEVKMILADDNKLVALYHTENGWIGPMQRISGTTIQVNTWYHVAAVINNGNIELYINGSADAANPVTNSLNSTLNFNNGRVTLGNARLYNGAYIATRWFKGKIDEAGIWNRPLSAGEVAMLYNVGNGLQYPF